MFLSLMLFFTSAVAPAADPAGPSVLGDWTAPDKSIVRIYKCNSAICMKIVYVNPAIGHTTDGLNPDPAKRGQPLCGLVIGTGFLQKNASRAEGGTLYDPESGNTYSGTLTLDGAMLRLHGYIGLPVFGRTEDWRRTPEGHPTCE
jgi:uncharacterized protein (DUF2147 family)